MCQREARSWKGPVWQEEKLKRGFSAITYMISRDEGICIGEEYTYGLTPLLASAETIIFSILKSFLLETS